MYVSYAQAVAAVRATMQVGYLHHENGFAQPLGANREPTQGDLLLAVLGAHSLFSDEQALENSYVLGGVGALAAWSEDHGAWVSWVVTWAVNHFELSATFTSTLDDQQVVTYQEDAGALAAPVAQLLNASRWRVLG